jgi:hypothetical protein
LIGIPRTLFSVKDRLENMDKMIRAPAWRYAVGNPAFACWRWNMQPAPVI